MDAIAIEVAGLRLEVEEELHKQLEAMGLRSEVHRILMLSSEPPAWIKLIADAPVWGQFLGAAAAVYCSGLLKKAGEETEIDE